MGALDTLLGRKSPVDMTATSDPYFNKRRAAIVGGESEFEPGALDLADEQQARAEASQAGGSPFGVGVSQDAIRDNSMQTLRRTLNLDARKHAQEMEKVTVPARIAADSRIGAAEATAQTALDRLLFSQASQQAMQNQRLGAQSAEHDKSIAATNAGREDTQQYHTDNANAPGLAQIAAQRQMLQKAALDPKNQVGTIGGWLGHKNQYAEQLKTFDNTLAAARDYAQKYPTQSVDQILQLEGENAVTPEERQQLNEFMLMLRGR